MIDVVLFEFENVLADTARLRRDALVRSLADDGVALSEAEYDEECAGFPVRDGAVSALAARRLGRDDTAVDLIALRAERYFAEGVGKGLSLAEGALELLEDLSGRARLGIVTRASRREVEFILSLSGLDSRFECIVTSDDVTAPKPSPESYERALERLGRRRPARPTTTLALEDGPPGIIAALAVRMRCIAVGSLPMYHAVQADAHLPSLVGQSLETLSALALASGGRSR